jgi:hypothetical protein
MSQLIDPEISRSREKENNNNKRVIIKSEHENPSHGPQNFQQLKQQPHHGKLFLFERIMKHE